MTDAASGLSHQHSAQRKILGLEDRELWMATVGSGRTTTGSRTSARVRGRGGGTLACRGWRALAVSSNQTRGTLRIFLRRTVIRRQPTASMEGGVAPGRAAERSGALGAGLQRGRPLAAKPAAAQDDTRPALAASAAVVAAVVAAAATAAAEIASRHPASQEADRALPAPATVVLSFRAAILLD
eukprot:COSAG02_NODE_7735_length_2868_cov_78.165042_3_plen_184_part_00